MSRKIPKFAWNHFNNRQMEWFSENINDVEAKEITIVESIANRKRNFSMSVLLWIIVSQLVLKRNGENEEIKPNFPKKLGRRLTVHYEKLFCWLLNSLESSITYLKVIMDTKSMQSSKKSPKIKMIFWKTAINDYYRFVMPI